MKTDCFYNIEKDGITQGLLSTWRNCRESAWRFLQGWSPRKTNMPFTYGNIIHAIIEKIYRDMQKKILTKIPDKKKINNYISCVERQWEKENPRASVELLKQKEESFLIAEAIMPIYFDYWHKDFEEMPWLGVEQEFNNKIILKDGRKTALRGKVDGVYKKNGIWLFETKNKSRIDESTLVDVLPLDFQNKFYLYNLVLNHVGIPSGIKYNIIRRTQMEQGKKETLKQFSQRLTKDILKRPDFYFIRYEIGIDKEELELFSIELMGQITEFYDWWDEKIAHYSNPSQCETKYGRCWALSICSGQNFNQYIKRERVFRELEDF